MDRKKRILLTFFAASVAVGWVCFDERLSRLGDNAEFIVISKGIVTGHGMSYVHGPTPEPALKFPPGYPAILTITQLISRDNVNLMKSVSILFFALAIPLTWLVIREIDTEMSATIVACSAMLSPLLIAFSHLVLSEIPYTAFSLAGILLLLRNRGSTDPKALLTLVILAVASYYIRTIGVTVIGAVVCTQFLDRRFKHGFLMGVVAALMILPWLLRSSAYLDQFSSINPYQPEISGAVSVGFLVDRVSQNLDKYGLTFFPSAFAPFLEFGSPHTWASNGLALLIDLLLLYFIILSIRRSRKTAPIGVYLILYLTVVLLWPEIWADSRLVTPIIPFAIYALFWSVRDLLHRVPIPEPYGLWAPYAFGAIVLLAHGTRSAATQIDHAPYTPGWRNYFDSAKWVRENTPPDALIVCRKPFLMNVISDRKTISYPWIRPRFLLRSFNKSEADYVVRDALFKSTSQVLTPAIVQYQASFLPVYVFEDRKTVVYEYMGYGENGNFVKLEQKLTALNKAIEEKGNDPATWKMIYVLGTMFHHADELERARQVYERVLPFLKDQTNVSLNLGLLHFAEGRFKASIVAFGNAASSKPKDVEARLGLAQAYERVGKFDEAMKQAKVAYQLDGKSFAALHTIARVAVVLKENKEAEEAFRRALEIDPKSAAVRNDLTFFYLKNRRYEEARGLLERLIRDDPERTELRLNMVTALTHLDRTEAAQTYLNDLLTNHRAEITQDPLKGIANRIIRDLANKMGMTAEALINAAEKTPR